MDTFPSRNISSFVILLFVLANIVLGGLVLLDSPRRKVNRLFFTLSTLFSVWGVSFIGFNLSPSATSALIWSRLYAVSVLFIPPLFYHLSLGSVGSHVKRLNNPGSRIPERIKQLAY